MHINLAALYLDRDDFKNAEQELREADKVAPDYPLILNNFGLLNLKLKRYDEALGYLIRSILKNPNEPQPHLYLAQVYDQTGQPDYAEKEYLTAINLSPLSHRAHAGLGEFYFDQGRLQEAERQFQESLRAAKTLRGYWGLGLVYWREGRYAEAEHAFQEAEALVPSSGRAHIMLGLLYTDTKRNREALRELQTGLKSEPTNPQALEALKKLQSQDSSSAWSNVPFASTAPQRCRYHAAPPSRWQTRLSSKAGPRNVRCPTRWWARNSPCRVSDAASRRLR